jgi:hypothetical protein
MEAECVCVYASSNAKADNFSCPIVESRYVCTRFKKCGKIFAVEGGIVSKISKIQEIFGYKFLLTSSNISHILLGFI